MSKYRTFSDYRVLRFKVSFASLTNEWQISNWVYVEWRLCLRTYYVLCSNERVPHSFGHSLMTQYVSENKNTCTDAASTYVVLGLGVLRLMQLWKKKKKRGGKEIITFLKRVPKFYLREWNGNETKAVGEYCCAITGGRAVVRRPIRFQCVAVWISTKLLCIYVRSWPHVCWVTTCAK